MRDDDNDNNTKTEENKRAHHNALERKRRDHLKNSYTRLQDSLPYLQVANANGKASRCDVLKSAAYCIKKMKRKSKCHQQGIEELRRQNAILEDKILALRNKKSSGNVAANSIPNESYVHPKRSAFSAFDEDTGSESSDIMKESENKRKKLKSRSSKSSHPL